MSVRAISRILAVLAGMATLAFFGACGDGESGTPEGGGTGEAGGVATSAAAPVTPIGGMYDVSGFTITTQTGYKRDIAGTVILAEAEDGQSYTATFNLTTTYPDPAAEKPLAAEVIGKGHGTIEGRTLRGSAETQLVVASVPDVDPGFAFIPRSVSTRIASSTVATIAADGTVSIQIENRPRKGEEYSPTRTTLRGARTSASGVADGVAAGP